MGPKPKPAPGELPDSLPSDDKRAGVSPTRCAGPNVRAGSRLDSLPGDDQEVERQRP